MTGEASFSVEKLYRHQSLEIGAGYVYPFKSWIGVVTFFSYGVFDEEYISLYHNQGFTTRIQFKYFLNRSSANSYWYIAPLFLGKHLWKTRQWVYSPGTGSSYENSYSTLESERREICGLQILLGHELFINKKIQVDFYVGPGIRYHYLHNQIYHARIFNGLNYNADPINNPVKLPNQCFWSYSCQTGFNLGFRIK